MGHKIPAFRADHTIINSRHDAALALANSNAHLMARGLVDGVSVVHKFGAAADVTTTLTPITSAQTYKTPTAAVALEAVSDDINDNGSTSPLGTGALTIRIYGLQTWAGETTADVTLNGTTAVAITGTWLRIYRVTALTSGTYATDSAPSHSSTITIRESGGGATWANFGPQQGFGLGQSEIAAYSVPTGLTAYIHTAAIFIEASKTANVLFFVRENADVITAPYAAMQTKVVLRHVDGVVGFHPDAPLGPFVGPCDIGWLGSATAQTANIEIDFEIELYNE